jgi:hypothetical protein
MLYNNTLPKTRTGIIKTTAEIDFLYTTPLHAIQAMIPETVALLMKLT